MSISDNIRRISDSIETFRSKNGIFYPVTIVAVTKTLPSSVINDAVAAGLTDIGENRVQEAEKKFTEIADLKYTRHLIGQLQSNKANKAAELFDMIQSIDSIDISLRLNRKLMEIKKIMPVLIEVNTSGEASKSGIHPDETIDFIGKMKDFPNVKISGLMTVGPLTDSIADIRKSFQFLKKLFDKSKTSFPELPISILSMGMSGDYETAIEEGSNMVRLGRILFGERQI